MGDPPQGSPVIGAGFYGKSPFFGDFLSRRMPAGFLPSWDAWLQQLVVASLARLGEAAWLPAWLEAPVWHFVLGAEIAGAAPGFGVLIPSVDRVGRYFPFTVLGLEYCGGIALSDWALRVEALALGALDDGFDPNLLETELGELGAPAMPACPPAAAPPGWSGLAGACDWPTEIDGASAALAAGETLWWCRGSSRVGAGMLRCTGLPDDQLAAALIAGFESG
jgi:type VI secretion system protein ImpM